MIILDNVKNAEILESNETMMLFLIQSSNLVINSKPGVGKLAFLKQLAAKTEMVYLDIRCDQICDDFDFNALMDILENITKQTLVIFDNMERSEFSNKFLEKLINGIENENVLLCSTIYENEYFDSNSCFDKCLLSKTTMLDFGKMIGV